VVTHEHRKSTGLRAAGKTETTESKSLIDQVLDVTKDSGLGDERSMTSSPA